MVIKVSFYFCSTITKQRRLDAAFNYFKTCVVVALISGLSVIGSGLGLRSGLIFVWVGAKVIFRVDVIAHTKSSLVTSCRCFYKYPVKKTYYSSTIFRVTFCCFFNHTQYGVFNLKPQRSNSFFNINFFNCLKFLKAIYKKNSYICSANME